MPTTYRAVMQTKAGGPENLQVVDLPLSPPGPGQLRILVGAAGVGSTDFFVLAGKYSYAPKLPLVPGYEVAGTVDAIGDGVTGFAPGQRVAALTVYGAFAESLTREAEHFLPIPDAVSDRDAAAVILNYVTAWQMIHRTANVQLGKTAVVTGAAGGVGTAALQLLRLLGIKTYGAASTPKHAAIRALGAIPIDSRSNVAHQIRALEPNGVDYAFDAIGGPSISACIGALRRGGTLVGFGFMGTPPNLLAQAAMFANIFIGSRLRGRIGKFYGITMLYRKNPQPLREDLPKIFALLADRKIDPLITRTFPLLEARQALEYLATATSHGKIVLTA